MRIIILYFAVSTYFHTFAAEYKKIDLLILRDDKVVNLCEMKFAGDVYHISKEEESKLRNRIENLKATLSPKQTVHLTLVTTYGVAYGKHSGIVQKQVKIDSLFESSL